MIDPVAFKLGPLAVRWYGICIAAGLVAGFNLQLWRAKKYDFTQDQVSDITFLAMGAGLVGARLLYVLRFWQQEFAGRFWDIFKIHQGGLVFYGGFLGAVLALVLLAHRRRWPVWRLADLIAPALALGHAFGRIGCLINGCCFGFPYHGPGAIRYPAWTDGFLNSVVAVQAEKGLLQPAADLAWSAPTFPLEGVAALGNLAICLILLWLEKRQWFRKRLFLAYIVMYTVGRFLLEFGRGDYLVKIAGLTPAQITCLWLLPAVAAVYAIAAFWSKRHPKTPA
ncbi:MAG: prolipoprotein diacylglyceryl transferase [Lentisphaeria bacterium]|jgi:phosphatidylglycerol:prolipoprotein diacylglycerol transferase|nr:prolipoprotein diacylglyceryl transferase [Lentisphaeria bacterium]